MHRSHRPLPGRRPEKSLPRSPGRAPARRRGTDQYLDALWETPALAPASLSTLQGLLDCGLQIGRGGLAGVGVADFSGLVDHVQPRVAADAVLVDHVKVGVHELRDVLAEETPEVLQILL